MPKIDKREILRLFKTNQLNAPEIGRKLGITRQYVYYILHHAGVELRKERFKKRIIDKDILQRLYVDQGQTLETILTELRAGRDVVLRSLSQHGIELRKRGSRNPLYPLLRKLKIGESIEVQKFDRPGTGAYVYYYSMAKVVGIRVSLKTINADTMRLTRVA